MRKPIILALAVALAAGVLADRTNAAPDPGDCKILILHVERVIDETEEGQALVGKLKARMAEEEKRLVAAQQKLAEKKKELQKAKLADRTPEFYEELEKAMDEHARIEMQKQLFLYKIKDEISRRTNELMRGAQQEARAIMKARGAWMVLTSRMGPMDVDSDQQFQQEIVLRRVVAAVKEADITEEVIKRMNKWYRENKRDKEGAVPTRVKGDGQ